MRKIFACFICLFFLMTTLVPDLYGQDRRRRSRFGRKARTAAMIAGGAAVGGLVGGKKGAAIGAGGAGTYAFNRKAARRHFKPRTRTVGATASGAALGAGVGGAVGGKRAAGAGAIVGGTGGYLYRRSKRRIPRR
ncbi:MAG TPA: hypothetical protein VEX60_09390, partial [Pyrinomonadaceae bacterium]|nr:hypothetical protein [Pyrinomonadaceae bacterium]